MALTLKNAKPGQGMQYELDLVGAVGRAKRAIFLEGLRQWCEAVREAQRARRPYSHHRCF